MSKSQNLAGSWEAANEDVLVIVLRIICTHEYLIQRLVIFNGEPIPVQTHPSRPQIPGAHSS